jgi:RNA polymerase sigma factor (sigma-70 family)
MAGDESAQTELCEHYMPRVLRVIKQSVGASADAEDLCQKTLIIALRRIEEGGVREPEKLSGFILGIAKKLITKHFITPRESPDNAKAYSDRVDTRPDPLEQLIRKEAAEKSFQAIPDRDREVLYRYYILKNSKQDICADLDISVHNFPIVLHRACSRFNKIFQELIAGE